MKYPEWAPELLIEWHKWLTSDDHSTTWRPRDPDTVIAEFEQKHGRNMTEAECEEWRKKLYRERESYGLPDKERIALLEKLITNLNMREVWKPLANRYTDERLPMVFFLACEHGITGWRGDSKRTAAERREFYQEIHDTARRLQSLMHEASQFDSYRITDLVPDESIRFFMEYLGVPISDSGAFDQEISNARLSIFEILPSIFEVLSDIGEKASQYRDEPSIVKKPNSDNAEIVYFLRRLSTFCQAVFNQPLHQVVTATTAVIFDRPDLDVDYVRKIVKG